MIIMMMMITMIMMTAVVMITRHLDMECEVSKQRRLILLEVKKRKDRENKEEEDRKMMMKIEKERLMMMIKTHDRTSSDMLDSSGCGAVGVNNEMNNNDNNDMIVVSKMKMCLQCNIEVKESMLPTHMTEQCTHRLILCPNYSMGCKEKFIILNTVQQHLMHECQVEKHRDVMIAKSKHRRGKVL